MATSNSTQKVTKGGLWNTQAVSYSKETQKLLKEMMQESKLTMFQQKHLDASLRNGKTLPVHVPPTHSYREKIVKPPAPPNKIINVREYTGGVRTKDVIANSGAYERPDYHPHPGKCRTEKEKEKFCNIMAYGQDIPPPDMKQAMEKATMLREATTMDRFDELELEIEDRNKFLEGMVAIGRGDEYRQIIETEISQKVREMEIIDDSRSQELQEKIDRLPKQTTPTDTTQSNPTQNTTHSDTRPKAVTFAHSDTNQCDTNQCDTNHCDTDRSSGDVGT